MGIVVVEMSLVCIIVVIRRSWVVVSVMGIVVVGMSFGLYNCGHPSVMSCHGLWSSVMSWSCSFLATFNFLTLPVGSVSLTCLPRSYLVCGSRAVCGVIVSILGINVCLKKITNFRTHLAGFLLHLIVGRPQIKLRFSELPRTGLMKIGN